MFSPLVIRGVQIPSRVFLAPINTGFAESNAPSKRLIDFHVRRSSRYVGINYIGNTSVIRSLVSTAGTLVLDGSSPLTSYSQLAARIAHGGSVPGIQLAASVPGLSAHRRWRALSVAEERSRLSHIVSSLTTPWLRSACVAFAAGVALASQAGFQVIQIHAAHGYLLSLLIDEAINYRDDQFSSGGSWFHELITQCRQRAGPSLLSLRLNLLNGLDDRASTVAARIARAESAVASGVDILDWSAGLYTVDRRLIYPGLTFNGPVYAAHFAEMLPGSASLTTVAGRIATPSELSRVPLGFSVGIARALIAEPHWAQQVAELQWSPSRQCRYTNRCHYFSRGRTTLECGVNPEV
jgi:2,4-dienoyl-CoA reductase-like NADH-dependent reductase (Old Yellow Enzyme family)